MSNKKHMINVYETLLERFGEPLHKQPMMVGARDEGAGDKALWTDEPKLDREWSDPDVVNEVEKPSKTREKARAAANKKARVDRRKNDPGYKKYREKFGYK